MVELPEHSAIYKLQVQQSKTALRQLCSFLSSKHTLQSIALFISLKSCRENPPQLWSHTWAASWVLFCTGVRLKLEQDRVPRLAWLRAGRRISTGWAVCWCWSEFLLLIQGGALTFHQVWLKVCTSNKPHQQVYLNYLFVFFIHATLWCVDKSVAYFFQSCWRKVMDAAFSFGKASYAYWHPWAATSVGNPQSSHPAAVHTSLALNTELNMDMLLA